MRIVSFYFVDYTVESVGHRLCENKQQVAFHTARILETACSSDWHLRRNFQYELFIVIGCQSEDRAEY